MNAQEVAAMLDALGLSYRQQEDDGIVTFFIDADEITAVA